MGEGISAGMESGYCAAVSVDENFDDAEKIYSDYIADTNELKEYMKRQWGFVAGMSETFAKMKYQ